MVRVRVAVHLTRRKRLVVTVRFRSLPTYSELLISSLAATLQPSFLLSTASSDVILRGVVNAGYKSSVPANESLAGDPFVDKPERDVSADTQVNG